MFDLVITRQDWSKILKLAMVRFSNRTGCVNEIWIKPELTKFLKCHYQKLSKFKKNKLRPTRNVNINLFNLLNMMTKLQGLPLCTLFGTIVYKFGKKNRKIMYKIPIVLHWNVYSVQCLFVCTHHGRKMLAALKIFQIEIKLSNEVFTNIFRNLSLNFEKLCKIFFYLSWF